MMNDNGGLSPKPRPERDRYESPDMARFFARMARAMVRRASTGDLEALSALRSSEAALSQAIEEAARAAHQFGYSWTDVGRELGITRQAARQRFTRPAPVSGPDGVPIATP